MQVICINDTFSDEQRTKIPNLPVKDRIYTIRDVVRYFLDNRIGLLLEEIQNPHIEHPTGLGTFEPNFNINRFTMLDGTVLTYLNVIALEKIAA